MQPPGADLQGPIPGRILMHWPSPRGTHRNTRVTLLSKTCHKTPMRYLYLKRNQTCMTSVFHFCIGVDRQTVFDGSNWHSSWQLSLSIPQMNLKGFANRAQNRPATADFQGSAQRKHGHVKNEPRTSHSWLPKNESIVVRCDFPWVYTCLTKATNQKEWFPRVLLGRVHVWSHGVLTQPFHFHAAFVLKVKMGHEGMRPSQAFSVFSWGGHWKTHNAPTLDAPPCWHCIHAIAVKNEARPVTMWESKANLSLWTQHAIHKCHGAWPLPLLSWKKWRNAAQLDEICLYLGLRPNLFCESCSWSLCTCSLMYHISYI